MIKNLIKKFLLKLLFSEYDRALIRESIEDEISIKRKFIYQLDSFQYYYTRNDIENL